MGASQGSNAPSVPTVARDGSVAGASAGSGDIAAHEEFARLMALLKSYVQLLR